MTHETSPGMQSSAETIHRPATVAIYPSLPLDPIRCKARKRWPRVYVTSGFATQPPPCSEA